MSPIADKSFFAFPISLKGKVVAGDVQQEQQGESPKANLLEAPQKDVDFQVE
jgi:hypothetical protein